MSSPSLTGYSPQNPRRYLGPNVAVPIIVVRNREPTTADIKQPSTGKYYSFGTFWLVGEGGPGVPPTTGTRGDLWYLSYIENNMGIWNRFSESFVTNTWTPNLQINGSNTGITYTGQLGGYTQMGNVVTIWASILLSSKGASNGIVTISNLPVQTISGINQFIPIGTFNGFTSAGYTSLSLRLNDNSTVGQILMCGSGVGILGVQDTEISNTFLVAFTGSYLIL